MGTQKWTQGRAEDVVMCSGKPRGTFQQITTGEILRVAEPSQGRNSRTEAHWQCVSPLAPSPCKEASQGAPQQVLCPPQMLFQFGISRAGHEQGDTRAPVLCHGLHDQTPLKDFTFPSPSLLS